MNLKLKYVCKQSSPTFAFCYYIKITIEIPLLIHIHLSFLLSTDVISIIMAPIHKYCLKGDLEALQGILASNKSAVNDICNPNTKEAAYIAKLLGVINNGDKAVKSDDGWSPPCSVHV